MGSPKKGELLSTSPIPSSPSPPLRQDCSSATRRRGRLRQRGFPKVQPEPQRCQDWNPGQAPAFGAQPGPRSPTCPGPRQARLPWGRSLEPTAGCFPDHPPPQQLHLPDGKCPRARTVKALVPGNVSFLLSASVSPQGNKNLAKGAPGSLPSSDN